MKYLIMIFSVFMISGCGNCDHCDDLPVIYDYSFINNSGYTVDVVPYGYSNGLPDYAKKITIPVNGKIQKEFRDLAPYDGFNMGKLLFENNIYEVDITFNNKKKIHYKSCTESFDCNINPRNIFNNFNNGKQTEIYILTSADYQNAIDCGGNCY